MVTPSAVVRVNRWTALPTLSPGLVASGTLGSIGHATAPELDEIDPTGPAEPGAEFPAGNVELGSEICTPACRALSGVDAPVELNATYPPAAPVAMITPAATAARRR